MQSSFGVLSSFDNSLSVQENARMSELLSDDISKLGYKSRLSSGEFKDIKEPTHIVDSISFEDLILLARKYCQEYVMYCSPCGTARVLVVKGVSTHPEFMVTK